MKVKLFSWNVRGANNPDKRNVIRNFIRSQRVDLGCLPETKIQEMSLACACNFWVGRFSEWKVVEAEGIAGVSLCFGIKETWTWWRLKHAFFLLLACLKTWRMVFSGPSQVSMTRLRQAKGKCFRKSWGR